VTSLTPPVTNRWIGATRWVAARCTAAQQPAGANRLTLQLQLADERSAAMSNAKIGVDCELSVCITPAACFTALQRDATAPSDFAEAVPHAPPMQQWDPVLLAGLLRHF
jgi:hypothetical protein